MDNRFARLDSIYLCCVGVHVKDAIQLIQWIGTCFLGFSFFMLSVTSPQAPSLALHYTMLCFDMISIVLLFFAHSRESAALLLPFILLQGINSAWMAIGALFYIIAFINGSEIMDYNSEAMAERNAFALASALIFIACSLISLWWTLVSLQCFRYFRDLANYKLLHRGNEFVESAISRQWTEKNSKEFS